MLKQNFFANKNITHKHCIRNGIKRDNIDYCDKLRFWSLILLSHTAADILDLLINTDDFVLRKNC